MKKNWAGRVLGSFIGTCLAILAVTFSANELRAMNAAPDQALSTLLAPALSPQFSEDCTDSWHHYSPGAGISAYATLNADAINATNSATWRPSLPETGNYLVEAYIPIPPTVDASTCFGIGDATQNTSQAEYTIQHASGSSKVTIDQQARRGSWVSLGTFFFSAGTGGYVRLRDLTGETKFTRFVTFSDVRFTRAQVRYFPLIYKEDASPPPPPPPQSIVVVRNNQAFDSCNRPTLSQMQTWWNASPYLIYNLYLGGVSNENCHPETLTASWIASARSQGWEFIPTWVGPQAPCTTFKYRFSPDPNSAFGEGVFEAELAFARAVTLGLTGSIDPTTVIYYDMEAFYGASDDCKQAVRNFLSGWSQRLHELGARSGVYGSSCYYMPDWKSLSNPLDDAWMASWYKVDHDNDETTDKIYYYYPYANVWDVACSSLLSTAWTNQQRIRQYAGGHNETWGNVTVDIDSNIVDGRVVSPFTPGAADIPTASADQAQALPETPGQPAATVQPTIAAYQLVAPDQGWVLQQDKLLWTEDGGVTWTDRTPSNIFARWLGVHFIDPQAGWALVADSDRDGQSGWQVLKTVDGGLSWQAYGLPVEPILVDMGEAAFFDFVDENLGWLSIRLRSGSAFSLGLLFHTQNGGQSWQQASIPLGEPVRFVDSLTGWVAGGAAGEELYVTRDGAITWQSAAFITADSGAIFYGLPQFSDPTHGVLSVTLADPEAPHVEVYRTQDGGKTWQLGGVIPLGTENPPGVMAPVAVIGSQAVLAVDVQADRMVAVNPDTSLFAPQGPVNLPPGVVDIEFTTVQHGWARAVLASCTGSKNPADALPLACQVQEALYRTTDGGVTWTKIR